MSGRRSWLLAMASCVAMAWGAPPAHAEQGGEDADRARDEGGGRVYVPPRRWNPQPRRSSRRSYDRGRRSTRRVVFTFGVEMGASVSPGLPESYGVAIGRGFSFGVGNGTIGAELLFGHSFTSESKFESLRAANTTGETSLFMIGARLNRRRRGSLLSVSLGAARVTVPVLGTDGSSVAVSGLGVGVGVGLEYPLAPAFSLTADLRGVAAIYEIPRGAYVEDVMEQPGGGVAGTLTTADVSAFPVFGTAGVRVLF